MFEYTIVESDLALFYLFNYLFLHLKYHGQQQLDLLRSFFSFFFCSMYVEENVESGIHIHFIYLSISF